MKSSAGSETGRQRVAHTLLAEGPATAVDLAHRLGISSAAVRKHLDALEADGLVRGSERPEFGPAPKRGRGRPARFYAITDAGRATFEQAYDDLAVAALRYLSEVAGVEAVARFARLRAEEMQVRYGPALAVLTDPAARASRLAELLTDDGFAASAEPGRGDLTQICQHHCPVGDVAHAFPQLCDAEAEAFSRLLGTNVTRLATIAHGDGVCTTLVSHISADSATHERMSR